MPDGDAMDYAKAFISSFFATMREILPWCLSIMALCWVMNTLGRWSGTEEGMILGPLIAFSIMAGVLYNLGLSGGDHR